MLTQPHAYAIELRLQTVSVNTASWLCHRAEINCAAAQSWACCIYCGKLQMFIFHLKKRLSWEFLLSLLEINGARKVILQKSHCHRRKLLSISKCLGQTQSWQNFVFIKEITSGVNMANFCSPSVRILHLSHVLGLTLIALISWLLMGFIFIHAASCKEERWSCLQNGRWLPML